MARKKKTIKAYYIDPKTNTAEPRDITPELDTYYELLHCTTIDIVTRKVKGKYYDIICDDEGLLVDDPLISAIDDRGRGMLCGALLIVGMADDEGYETSLTDEDIAHIQRNVHHMCPRLHPKGWKMLCQCEY